MIDITNRIQEACDNGQYACGIYVDFKKVFDTVNHNILPHKLAHYGVRRIENNWFKTFLTNRKQHVTVSGQKSDNALIEFGVPQGSVLGPLLFLIYINDLNQAIKFSRVHHFADDTNLLLVDNSLKKRSKHINHDLKLLTAWLRANRISLNTSKIKILLFRPKSKRNITKHLNLRISGQYIPGKHKSNTWASQLMNISTGIYLYSTRKETQLWDWASGKNKTFYSKALIENPLLFII